MAAICKYIFNDWFDGSGYAFDHTKMDFEMYLGQDAFIYVPVKKKYGPFRQRCRKAAA